METFAIIFVILFVLWCVYAYIKHDTLTREERYKFIVENLVFGQIGLDQVKRLQETYCPDETDIAARLRQAQASINEISRVKGNLGMYSAGQLEACQTELLAVLWLISRMRTKVMSFMTDEELVKEGLDKEDK